MRVTLSGRNWSLIGLAMLWVGAATAQARRMPIGPDGPAWMQPPRATRQATTPPTPDVNITQSPGDDRDAVWSADGTLIAFASNRAGSYDVYLSRIDGSHPDTGAAHTPKLISGLAGVERYPAFSPGGTELAYIRDNAIYIRNLRTGIESLVSDQVGTPTGLVFSFDGQRLAFSSRIGTDLAPNIYWISLNPNNRALTRVTDTASNDVAPAWFPQSNIIAFASDRQGDYDIYQVTVNGPGQPAVPEAQQTVLVNGLGNQTEPAWVNAGGIISDPAYNQPYHLLYADDAGGTHFDIRVADTDGTPTGDIVFSDDTATTPGQQTGPFANPTQSAVSSLCVYAGNQTGNYELYTITIFDGSPPILSDGLQATLPTVVPQQTFPGAQVTITVNIFDLASPVREVWALIRRAEVSTFQRNTLITGTNDQDGIIGSGGNDRVAMGFNNVEYEHMIINANTYADVDPRTVALSAAGLTAMVQNAGLQLFDDGARGGDVTAGDGLYTATWTTPALAQDFYVDIIPFDQRGNFPFDLNLGVNQRPGGGINPLNVIRAGFPGNPFYCVGYDHVAGFTTRSLDLTRKILLVSDYGCGQKFQVADFAGAEQTTLNRFWPAAIPVEHYFFNTDDTNGDVAAANNPDTPQFTLVGANPPTVHLVANPYYGVWPFGGITPTPPDQTGDTAMAERPGTNPQDEFPYAGNETSDRKAVWRILCRGPLDAPTLNAYTPLPLPQPAGSPIPAQDADRMILWIAPNLGDLFVQPGTLLDAEVQQSLANFVNTGGRLFLSGQDVAWALTKNGTQANTFLTNTLRANFVSDAPPEIDSSTVRGGNQRRFLTPTTALTGIELAVFQTTEHPFAVDLYPDYIRWLDPRGGVDFPNEIPIRLNTGPVGNGEGAGTTANWAGDGCPNQWFIDDITPASGGIDTFSYASGGQTAMVRQLDATTGGRVVFGAFGYEAMRNGFSYRQNFTTNTHWVIGHENRVEIFTNISDYLRTGGLLGKVVGPDGSTPVGGITIVARRGPLPDGTVMATTTSLADGTYLLRGLSTGTYSVYVVSNEFTADHRPYRPTQGGQINANADLTIRLLRFETGTIVGTVSQTGGATVSGATVTATLQTTSNNPFEVTVQTDNNGQYSLDVPAGTYTVTAEAQGFGSASQTDVIVVAGDIVQVDLALQPSPGTLTGTVTGSNQPVSGAVVAIQQQGVTVASTTTNSAGTFSIQLAAGTYNIVLTASGFQQATQNGVVVVSDETTALTFTLTAVPPGSLTGLISLQGSTAPVAGVTVNLVTGGAIVRTTTSAGTATTADGDTYNYRFDTVPAGLYDVQISATGFSAQPRTAITVTSGQVTTDVDFTLQPLHTFVAGLSMTSAPFDYTAAAPDLQTLIDDDDNPATRLRLAAYDTLARSYIYYPNVPAKTLQLGRGYFLQLSRNEPLTTQGVRAPEVGAGFDLQLLAGWNLIGHVYEFPVDLFECRVLFQNQNLTMQQAAAQGLVNASLFTLNFNQYQQVFRLDPYTGYWLRAFQNVVLRVPPQALRSAGEAARAQRSVATPESWLAELVATGADGRRATASFGVAADAAAVYDAHDRAQPPRAPTGGYLELNFPHEDWGRFADRYRSDVRSRQASQTWEFEVETDQAGGTVELSWPALGTAVPGNLQVVLTDRATGQRKSMRHTASWSIAADGQAHAFAIEVSRAAERAVIGQLGFVAGRGGTGSVSYTLSGPLTVTLEIRGGGGGRLVRRLVRGESRAEGTASVAWDGRDEQGRPVPNGTYTIQMVGVDELGRQVRVVRTIEYRR